MAVFTHVERAPLMALLTAYDIGSLERFDGIQQGVENTNYHVWTDRGRLVLTLFEKRTNEADLPFFIEAMRHFSNCSVPAPLPVQRRDGGFVSQLAGRPAIFVSFLNGSCRMSPSCEDAGLAGEALARLHLAADGFALTRINALSISGWRTLAAACRKGADRREHGLARLIAEELDYIEANWVSGLPTGLIHADFFPDNVFFDNGQVSGIIDFYFACTDSYAYDLAIALNAWCSDAGVWRPERATSLLAGYRSVRALSSAEESALAILLRGAALRFLLTRLFDWLNRIDGALVAVKDPLEYAQLLRLHRSGGSLLGALGN